MRRIASVLAVVAIAWVGACHILDPQSDVEVTMAHSDGPIAILFGWEVVLMSTGGEGRQADFSVDSLPVTLRASVDSGVCPQLRLQVWEGIVTPFGGSKELIGDLRLGSCGVFYAETYNDAAGNRRWTVTGP